MQQAYLGGYEHPIEVGGAVFTPSLVLSPFGWHGGCGNEQWTSGHTSCLLTKLCHKRTTNATRTAVGSYSCINLEQTTRRGVTHDVEGPQSSAEAAQGRAGA